MKKAILLVMCLFIFGFSGIAQLTNTMSIGGNGTKNQLCFYDVMTYAIDFPQNNYCEKQMTVQFNDTINKTVVVFYNMDGAIYKKLYLSAEYNSVSDVFLPSVKQFNSDDLIEFIISRGIKDNNGQIKYACELLNENGDILYQFDKSERIRNILKISENKFLLKTSIGSISGGGEIYNYYSISNLSNSVKSISISKIQQPFPNPSQTTVNLPYQISSGQSATMNIFDVNGKSITTKQIDASADRLQLDVSNYAKGIYLYEYNGKSGKFVVE